MEGNARTWFTPNVAMHLEGQPGALADALYKPIHGIRRERAEVFYRPPTLTTDVLHCFPMCERGLHR
jgi:hypothetical protein